MREKRCDALDWGLLKSLFKMAASVELGDSLEELEELFLKDIKACEQALPRGAGGRAGRGRGTKKETKVQFSSKKM